MVRDFRASATRPARLHFAIWLSLVFLGVAGAAGEVFATITFPSTPDWESTPNGLYGTGCALRDLNGDTWPDLVVANGNDMARQALTVYVSSAGVLPASPTWTSSDVDYNGHLDLADVDGDGALDCAVAVYIGSGGFAQPGHVKLYRGNGDGTFSSTPIWVSTDPFYCFAVAFGDSNEDGRPDLACVAGEPYNRYKARYRVFRNVSGTLEGTPSWQSADTKLGLDVTWGDINRDGHLDLIFAGAAGAVGGDPSVYRNEVYFGDGSSFPTSPGWQSQDARYLANTLCAGDLNGDGWLDLAVADNRQTGVAGDGRTKVYLNNGAGQLGGTPAWTSSFDGYGSHVSFADVDRDGDLDLAAGSWWGPVRIYENQSGSIPTGPTWQSGTSSVIENLVWEDANNDALAAPSLVVRTGDGSRRLFEIGQRPVRMLEVSVNGVAVPPNQYSVSTENGWIVLPTAPSLGSQVRLRCAVPAAPDLALSNWDASVGDYLFYNDLHPLAAQPAVLAAADLTVLPNPSRGATTIAWRGSPREDAALEVFALNGTRVRHARLQDGSWSWDGRGEDGARLPGGVYWVRVHSGSDVAEQRVVLVR